MIGNEKRVPSSSMAGGKGGGRIGRKGRSSCNQGRIRKDGYSSYRGFTKDETIGKAAAQLLRDIMPVAIAEAMKTVGKMLGKGRWVRAESGEEHNEGTIGEKKINDEGLGGEIECEELNPSKRYKLNCVEMEGMKAKFQQEGSCGKCRKRHIDECRFRG
ncbi:hypothetical protein L1987_07922 [Smallanthus sonchifolius]|uniref:Uncharacterized protein n=1 Tax=Smallanthus sonchifolius TaxID=185202 RepID=A0ACB9JKY6_9ASTR|nr:hypothetical protein L1987_07922 [Smallanthus sonchifolius]